MQATRGRQGTASVAARRPEGSRGAGLHALGEVVGPNTRLTYPLSLLRVEDCFAGLLSEAWLKMMSDSGKGKGWARLAQLLGGLSLYIIDCTPNPQP